MSRLALFFALTLLALTPLASADIPHLISLQGRLTDASDNPIYSSSNFVFRIYDAPSGGTPLWTEFQTLAPNSLGIFSAFLGSVAALNIPFNTSYWLEVQVNSEVLSPRQRMGSAGYALRSENPWNATGNNIYTTNPGNVGIGTSSPLGKLQVSGGNAIFGGNVGIGTTDPAGYNLRVAGSVRGSSFTDEDNTGYYLDPASNSVMNTINSGTPITSANIGSQSVNYANSANSVPWSGVTSKPTTVAGYGITDMGSQSVNYANSAGSAPLKHYKAFASCYAESRGCPNPVCTTEPVPASCPAGYTQTYYADKDNIPALPPLGDYDYNFPVRDTTLFDAGPWAVHYADVKDMYGEVLASATTGADCGNCAICAYRVCVQN